MRPCAPLNDYCIGRLNKKDRAAFAAHLSTCRSCEAAVAKWRAIGGEIRGIGETLIAAEPEPSAVERRRIIEAVQNRKTAIFSARILVPAAAAAVIILLGLSLFWFDAGKDQGALRDDGTQRSKQGATARFIRNGVVSSARGVSIGDAIRPLPGERALLQIGGDKVGLDEAGALVIGETGAVTRIQLVRGRLACSVAPRRGREKFSVVAGSREVRVVGTRFLVSRGAADEMTVAVQEGTVVVVSENGQTEKVVAGQREAFTETPDERQLLLTPIDEAVINLLLSTDLASPPPAVVAPADGPSDVSASETPGDAGTDRAIMASTASPKTGREKSWKPKPETSGSLATWQQWVLAGRVAEAAAAVAAYLKPHPNDTEAWFLLADCKQRQNKYKDAVVVYRQLMDKHLGRVSDTARFRAGAILQEQLGDHRGAIDLFEGFLKRTGPGHHLEAEAMLRLARSLRATGNGGRARQLLEDIVENHSATSAAMRAKKMLDEE